MFQRILHPVTGPAPYLVVGLGNPGREYRENRHNAGFMLVDRLAQALTITIGKVQHRALVGAGVSGGKKVILAKPQTYMNLSGQSVGALMRFYKIPLEQLLVAHDDLDLPLGTLRLRPGGGPGGQKGIGSTIEQLGTPNFARLRIGIGRPPGQMDPAAYVLQNFNNQERDLVDATLERAVKAARTFLDNGFEAAMNQFNGGLKEG